MAHISMHFMKTSLTSKIHQISGYENHLKINLTCIFLSVGANFKNPVCHDGPCTKPHFEDLDMRNLQYVMKNCQKNHTKATMTMLIEHQFF